jgi:hypothetical protein
MRDLKLIAESLRKVTEALALQVGGRADATPEWSEFDWKIAQAAVAMHGIGPLLSQKPVWNGPPFWQEFLVEQLRQSSLRHQRIQLFIDRLLDEFTRAKIRIVMLKGAALYRAGYYANGERPMADVDVLVPPEARKAVGPLLSRLNYSLALSVRRHDVYENPNQRIVHTLGEHAENPTKIEIHSAISESLLVNDWDITDVVFPNDGEQSPGAYPGSWALMAHLLLHAARSMQTKTLRILHLSDIARMAVTMSDDDWKKILSIRAGKRPPWWAFPPLKLACRYFPAAVPSVVLGEFEYACPAFLRTVARKACIAGVSLSHLWISPFFGMEWASSPADLLQYLFRRIVVEEDIRAARRLAASLPLAGNEWYRLPQWRRALRWLTSRPPRPGTMLVIDSVLGV